MWEAEGLSGGFVSHVDKLFAEKGPAVTNAANEGSEFGVWAQLMRSISDAPSQMRKTSSSSSYFCAEMFDRVFLNVGGGGGGGREGGGGKEWEKAEVSLDNQTIYI